MPKQTYEPLGQASAMQSMEIALLTTGDPASLAVPARPAVRSLYPQQAVGDMTTMQAVVNRSTAPRQFDMALFAVFGAASLLLSRLVESLLFDVGARDGS